jgi:lipopolysaccharide export system permease protein
MPRRAAPSACFEGERTLASATVRLLDRYLLRELLVPLGYCLGAFLMFWIAFDLFTELEGLQEYKMRAGDVARYYLVRTPEFMVMVLPIALLLALLYTLTNHARHHEIAAVRAAGVSLWRLAVPYFGVGLAASLVLFVLNEFFVPDSADVAERIKFARLERQPDRAERHLIRNQGFTNDRDGRRWVIAVFNERTGEMFDPQVFWRLPDGSDIWLRADRAVPANEGWTFFNVRELRGGPTNATLVPGLQTNVLTLAAFTETPDEIRSEIKIKGRLNIRKARKADVPIFEILDYLRLHPNPKRSDRFWLYTKLHGRLAAPWTCLVVVLIALPFGAASGRRNIFVGVASSIFICFTFFVLLQLGLALGTGGYLPAWLAAWFPNLTFGLAGLWLTARVR